MDVNGSLNYCSQKGGNLYRAPYYTRNLNMGPRIDSNLGQSPCEWFPISPGSPKTSEVFLRTISTFSLPWNDPPKWLLSVLVIVL